MSPRLVPPLPSGTPGDPGLTGPGSVTWRISRERVVSLGGLSALLLQLAHPLVAAGVAEHSSFQGDPAKRLMLTLEMLMVTTFGDVRQVGEMTRRIANIHRFVNGSLQEDVGEWHRGIPMSPWGDLLAAGLLPAPLRTQYGLRWSAAQQALWWLFTHAVRVVMGRLAPARLRFWGHYHVAVARCRQPPDPSVARPSRDARSGER